MDASRIHKPTFGSDGIRPQGVRRPGFTIVELIIALSILLIAASIFYRMVASTAKLRQVNRENAVAADAARVLIEGMRNRTFSELFALYNNDPNDDPGDPGTAPGSLFFVDRLKPLASSPGGLVGEVFLPTRIIEVEVAGGSTVVVEELWVCEDTVDAGLGMPRDLNGDSVVDDQNHADDYIILPVRVVIRWQGMFGERSLRVVTMLTDFEPHE
jgi:prepilin-type N-terminal cleavage/methylation domain-containing protein